MTHGLNDGMMTTNTRIRIRLAALAGVTMLLAACGAAADGEAAAEVSEGQLLYEAQCAMCHGDTGLGDGPMAAGLPVVPPSLMDHLGHHPADQLRQIILTGVPPAMPPANMTEDQVQLVVDYAWTLVPEDMVEALREMQRMAEMGVDMERMGEMMDSTGIPEMDHGAMGHTMPDSTGR